MMGIYERAAAMALRMLVKYGQDITLRTFSAGTYTDSAVVGATQVDTTRRGALFEFTSTRYGGDTFQVNTLVQQGFKQLLVDTNGPQPLLTDHVIVAGTEYVIVVSKPLAPAGINVVYELLIKT